MFGGEFHGSVNLFEVLGQHDRKRGDLIDAGIGAVQHATVAVGADVAISSFGEFRQVLGHNRRQRLAALRSGLGMGGGHFNNSKPARQCR